MLFAYCIGKTVLVTRYLRSHQEIKRKLVDLIGITSILEVLVRLVGADQHIYAFHAEALQWPADSGLLEMLVDRLSPAYFSTIYPNTAETLSAVTRIAWFVAALLNMSSRTLIHSLSVRISLLDPKRAASVTQLVASIQQIPCQPRILRQ